LKIARTWSGMITDRCQGRWSPICPWGGVGLGAPPSGFVTRLLHLYDRTASTDQRFLSHTQRPPEARIKLMGMWSMSSLTGLPT